MRNTLILAILGGREISGDLRGILELPARMGGMGFLNLYEEADWEYDNSKRVTAQLAESIVELNSSFIIDEEVQDSVMLDLKRRTVEGTIGHR